MTRPQRFLPFQKSLSELFQRKLKQEKKKKRLFLSFSLRIQAKKDATKTDTHMEAEDPVSTLRSSHGCRISGLRAVPLSGSSRNRS